MTKRGGHGLGGGIGGIGGIGGLGGGGKGGNIGIGRTMTGGKGGAGGAGWSMMGGACMGGAGGGAGSGMMAGGRMQGGMAGGGGGGGIGGGHGGCGIPLGTSTQIHMQNRSKRRSLSSPPSQGPGATKFCVSELSERNHLVCPASDDTVTHISKQKKELVNLIARKNSSSISGPASGSQILFPQKSVKA